MNTTGLIKTCRRTATAKAVWLPLWVAVCFLVLDGPARGTDADSIAGMPAALRNSGNLDWNPEHFWNKGRRVTAEGSGEPIDSVDRLGALNALQRFMFLEEGTKKAAIRTGYEVALYRLIKQRIREGRSLMTPEDVFCMAAQACRQADDVANVQIAMLCAHNVVRILARPQQWSTPAKDTSFAPYDPVLPIFQDLLGKESVDDGPVLPKILNDHNRLRFATVRGTMQVNPTWCMELFKPDESSQAFIKMPGTTDALNNAGSHYYYWVGAIIESVAPPNGSTAAMQLEMMQKMALGETQHGLIQKPNYYAGVRFSSSIKAWLTTGVMGMLQHLQGSDVGRLGLAEMTWWLMLTRGRFVPNIEANFQDSRNYLNLLSDLVDAGRFAPGCRDTDPQKYLPATERIANKYTAIIDALLPGDGDALLKLRRTNADKTRKMVAAKIKDLVAPSVTIHGTIALGQSVRLASASSPIKGCLEYRANKVLAVEFDKNRSAHAYFAHIDEFDAVVRNGRAIVFRLMEPWRAAKTVLLNREDVQEDADGNLAVQLHATFDPAAAGGATIGYPRLIVSARNYVMQESTGERLLDSVKENWVRPGHVYSLKGAPSICVEAQVVLMEHDAAGRVQNRMLPFLATIRVAVAGGLSLYVPTPNEGQVNFRRLPGSNTFTAEAIDPTGRILDTMMFRVMSEWNVPANSVPDLRKQIADLRDPNNPHFRSSIDVFNLYGSIISNQMDRMAWSDAQATVQEVMSDPGCQQLVAGWDHGQWQLRDWRCGIAYYSGDFKTLFTIKREIAAMFPNSSQAVWEDLARLYLVGKHDIASAWECWLKSLPVDQRPAAAKRGGDAWPFRWPIGADSSDNSVRH